MRKKPGSKSAASLTILPVAEERRPEPPEELTEEQGDISQDDVCAKIELAIETLQRLGVTPKASIFAVLRSILADLHGATLTLAGLPYEGNAEHG